VIKKNLKEKNITNYGGNKKIFLTENKKKVIKIEKGERRSIK
jgi:hypothetical protein